MVALELGAVSEWIGKSERTRATIVAQPADLLNATLGRRTTFQNGDVLPPAWHWLYFHSGVTPDDLGTDGHAKRGGFMPPISLPRRMWASGSLQFHQPVPIGAVAVKQSVIRSITPKSGRTGQLCFVDVEHQLHVGQERCVTEIQTLVYREAPKAATAAPVSATGSFRRETHDRNPAVLSPEESLHGSLPGFTNAQMRADFTQVIQPDAVMLFRYSALTFNSHRIHYDVDYCRDVEGYPGLVVHGPLIATLLLDMFSQNSDGKEIAAFDYRGHSPLFSPHRFTISGTRDGSAWATDHRGEVAMSATVTLRT